MSRRPSNVPLTPVQKAYQEAVSQTFVRRADAVQRARLRDSLVAAASPMAGLLEANSQEDADDFLGYLLGGRVPNLSEMRDALEANSLEDADDSLEDLLGGRVPNWSDGIVPKEKQILGNNSTPHPKVRLSLQLQGDDVQGMFERNLESFFVQDKTAEAVFTLDRMESYGKNTRSVDLFGGLEIPVAYADEGEKQKYQMTAFIVHDGESNKGHYRAYIKEQKGEGAVWVHYNDSTRTELGSELPSKDKEYAKKNACVLKYSPINQQGKCTLPQAQTAGTLNGRNKCWANAAFAFAMSMVSLHDANYQAQEMAESPSVDLTPEEEDLLDRRNIALKAPIKQFLEFVKNDGKARNREEVVRDFEAIADFKPPEPSASVEEGELVDGIFKKRSYPRFETLYSNCVGRYLNELASERVDKVAEIEGLFAYFSDRENVEVVSNIIQKIESSQAGKQEFFTNPKDFVQRQINAAFVPGSAATAEGVLPPQQSTQSQGNTNPAIPVRASASTQSAAVIPTARVSASARRPGAGAAAAATGAIGPERGVEATKPNTQRMLPDQFGGMSPIPEGSGDDSPRDAALSPGFEYSPTFQGIPSAGAKVPGSNPARSALKDGSRLSSVNSLGREMVGDEDGYDSSNSVNAVDPRARRHNYDAAKGNRNSLRRAAGNGRVADHYSQRGAASDSEDEYRPQHAVYPGGMVSQAAQSPETPFMPAAMAVGGSAMRTRVYLGSDSEQESPARGAPPAAPRGAMSRVSQTYSQQQSWEWLDATSGESGPESQSMPREWRDRADETAPMAGVAPTAAAYPGGAVSVPRLQRAPFTPVSAEEGGHLRSVPRRAAGNGGVADHYSQWGAASDSEDEYRSQHAQPRSPETPFTPSAMAAGGHEGFAGSAMWRSVDLGSDSEQESPARGARSAAPRGHGARSRTHSRHRGREQWDTTSGESGPESPSMPWVLSDRADETVPRAVVAPTAAAAYSGRMRPQAVPVPQLQGIPFTPVAAMERSAMTDAESGYEDNVPVRRLVYPSPHRGSDSEFESPARGPHPAVPPSRPPQPPVHLAESQISIDQTKGDLVLNMKEGPVKIKIDQNPLLKVKNTGEIELTEHREGGRRTGKTEFEVRMMNYYHDHSGKAKVDKAAVEVLNLYRVAESAATPDPSCRPVGSAKVIGIATVRNR